MTKPLATDQSNAAPLRPASARARAVLVALLGFGAADLLVLNLWAVPKVFTTTDVRAAQSGDGDADVQGVSPSLAPPQAVAVEDRQPVAAEPLAQPEHVVAEVATDTPTPATGDDLAQEAAAELAADDAVAEEPQAPPTPPNIASSQRVESAAVKRGEAVAVAAVPQPSAARRPRPAAEPVNPEPTGVRPEGRPLTRLFFRLGNFAVGPSGRATLEQFLGQLTADQAPIVIVGSADPSGPEQLNETLADARAQSVADWLVEHGVDRARLQTRAIGNAGTAGSALDRRVDIWLGGSQ